MNAARLQRLVTLKPGEGRPVGLIVSVSFFVSAGLMIGQSGIEALFFDRYGVDKLPVMYLVLGATMFLATIGYGGLLARLGRGRATIVIPVAMAVLAAAGRVGLEADLAWITPALWLLQGVGYFVLGLALWGLAGIVTDTRQAKRFFPLIGAGGVLGYVVGGLVTKPFAAWFGTPNLLLVWVVTLVVAAALGLVLLSDAARGGRRTGPEPGVRPLEQLTVGLRSVARSPLMRWLALGSILFSLLFFSLYLPFSRAATERYPSPDDLAGFFGLFFGLSTGVAFLLSLFVTNRLLARFGVPTVLLVLPLLYVVAFGVLAIESSFAVLMVFRFAQVAWLQGGASASTEAVINTVPADRRDQTRAFIYGGPTQVGTVLAGVIALIGERALSPGMLYLIGFISAVLATIAMVGVRRAYPRELVQALREGRPSVFGAGASSGRGTVVAEPFGLVRADASAVEVAVGALADRDARVRRVAAMVLGDLDAPAATSGLLGALHDDDDDVRADAVRSLARSQALLTLADIMRLVVDPAPTVRLAAVQAIRSLGIQREAASHAVGPLMHDRDPSVRVSAVATLVEIDGHPAAMASLVELAADGDAAVRAAAFRELGRSDSETSADVVLAGLDDPAPEARAAAARALASLDPGRAVDALVAATADEHELVRMAACDGLEAIGEPAVDPLVAALDDARLRVGALTALERLPIQRHETDVRRFAVGCRRRGGRSSPARHGARRRRERGRAPARRFPDDVGRSRCRPRFARSGHARRRRTAPGGDRQPVGDRPGSARERARGDRERVRPRSGAAVAHDVGGRHHIADRSRRCAGDAGIGPRRVDPFVHRPRDESPRRIDDADPDHPLAHGARAVPAQGAALRDARAPRPGADRVDRPRAGLRARRRARGTR